MPTDVRVEWTTIKHLTDATFCVLFASVVRDGGEQGVCYIKNDVVDILFSVLFAVFAALRTGRFLSETL